MMKLWEQIEEIKNFALDKFKQVDNKDCVDEWHDFKGVCDVHLETLDEPDAYGHYPLKIVVYPLVYDHLNRVSTDTSKGIEIF